MAAAATPLRPAAANVRILIASDSFLPKVDGVADTAATVAASLQDRGHRVAVFTATKGAPRHGEVTVIRAPSLPLPVYPEVRIAAPFRLARRVVEAFRPDACMILTTGPVGLATARSIPPGIPLVHVYTTDMPRYLRDYHLGLLNRPFARILHWLTARATVTLCPTDAVRRTLAADGHPRLAVWGRGVDTALFAPGRCDAQMRDLLTGGEPAKPLVLFVGRLAREKRLLDLYAAARQLPGVRFAIVGDGPQRDLLERRFATVPSIFTGYLRGKELATAYASGDLFAFPSDTETFGQVVLQAMASGLPPVVVEGSAPAEFVQHGVSGLHVPGRQPDALAGALRELIEAPARRESMARAGVASASQFTWPALVDRLEAMLDGRTVSPPIPAAAHGLAK
ncbi:MAG: glycosyltransferase family 4 protein [Dehalococcoidia bacterium]